MNGDTRISATHLGVFMLVGLLSLALASLVWNRRTTTPGARALVATLVSQSMVLIPYALSYAAVFAPSTKVSLIDVTYIGWAFMPPAYLLFIAGLTGRNGWLTPWALRAIAAISIALSFWALLPWARASFFAAPRDPVTYLVEGGLGYWVLIGYANVFLAAATVLVIRTVKASQTLHRMQAGIILITVTLPWVLSYASNVNWQILGSDPTVLTLVVCSGFAFLASQFRVFDLRPMAQAERTAASDAGVVVFDAYGRVTEMNARAVRLLGPGISPARGRRVEELWSRQPAIVAALRGADLKDVNVAADDGSRPLSFERSEIRDSSGRLVGYVVIVRTDAQHEAPPLSRV